MTSCDTLLVFLSAIEGNEEKGSVNHNCKKAVKSSTMPTVTHAEMKMKTIHFKYSKAINTHCLEVVCIVYFFGHKAVHIC